MLASFISPEPRRTAPATMEPVSSSRILTDELPVIIPAFNEPAQSERALIIIRNQLALATARGKSLVINGGSSENTWEKLATHARLLPVAFASPLALESHFHSSV